MLDLSFYHHDFDFFFLLWLFFFFSGSRQLIMGGCVHHFHFHLCFDVDLLELDLGLELVW